MNRYSSYSLQPQAVPIPFHKLLKVVAVVDPTSAPTKELLAQISAEGYEVETASVHTRDIGEDASVGAYILLTDGGHLEGAKALVRGVRGFGFRTPLWALADTHRISDLPVVGGLGEAVASTLLRRRVTPAGFELAGLPDAFLDAGALPTLHDRYGISRDTLAARIKAWLG